jgi:hypothetical protein
VTTFIIGAEFDGSGALQATLPGTKAVIAAAFAGNGVVAVPLRQIQRSAFAGTVFAGAGGGIFVTTISQIQRSAFANTRLSGTGGLTAIAGKSWQIAASLSGVAAQAAMLWLDRNMISAVFPGGFINPDTGSPYGAWDGRGHMVRPNLINFMELAASWTGETSLTVGTTWLQADFMWPGIIEDAGSAVLYRNAAGLEKALADVDAFRLTQTYAELVKDQWDPWRIYTENLPFLAWAMGVNLWEDDWPTEFRRWFTANQWRFKYERGSRLGLIDFVNTINASPGFTAKTVKVTSPPAQFMPGPALTDAERKAYVARFPQLRIYPYAPRPQLPWLNYLGGFQLVRGGAGRKKFVHNGHFFGPLWKFYPTNYNAGGKYLRRCTVYEPRTGVETECTVRRVYGVLAGRQKPTYYDEVMLPAISGNIYYPGAGNKQYLLPQGYALNKTRKHAVILGRIPYTNERLVRIPRDGSLDITQFQAIFQTIKPGLEPLQVRPEHVYVKHPRRIFEFYCNTPMHYAYLTKSNAWMYLYERWYLFDATRLPDYRKAYVYMGRSRFGIPKYTAEAKIQATFVWPRFYARANYYFGSGRYFPPRNTKLIDKLRRAVTASMAARDTVLINTRVKRIIQLRDITVLDGRFKIGQYLTDIS